MASGVQSEFRFPQLFQECLSELGFVCFEIQGPVKFPGLHLVASLWLLRKIQEVERAGLGESLYVGVEGRDESGGWLGSRLGQSGCGSPGEEFWNRNRCQERSIW